MDSNSSPLFAGDHVIARFINGVTYWRVTGENPRVGSQVGQVNILDLISKVGAKSGEIRSA